MNAHDKRIVHSSEAADWRTPPALFKALHQEFNFQNDLASDIRSALLPRHLGPGGISEDALAYDWTRLQQPNFLNPPYSKAKTRAYRNGFAVLDGEGAPHSKHPHEKSETKAAWYEIENWAEKCWSEARNGCTTVGLFPYSSQTEWWVRYVLGLEKDGDLYRGYKWAYGGLAATEIRLFPHRVSYLRPDGTPAGNAGGNSCVIIWKPNPGYIGPWSPTIRYWSY